MKVNESSSTLDDMPWCCCHTFVVNGDGKEGLHWFVCAFDRRVWSECFIIWVWEPLISLICPFAVELKRHGFTTNHRALGSKRMVGFVVFIARTSLTWWWTGVLFRMFASPQCLRVLLTVCWTL